MSTPPRIVIDTNVLVGSAYASHSASARIVAAVRARALTMVLSPAVLDEYRHILPRAVRRRDRVEELLALAEAAECVEPEAEPRVVADDPADDKFVAAAVAGNADALITNDRAVLDVGAVGSVRIVRPGEFVASVQGP